MAKYSRLQVLNRIVETGIVPLFYHGDVETAVKIVAACLDGGVRCIEFTNRGDLAHTVFEQVLRRFQKDGRLILGAGSILDAGTASLYIQLGANFIVGPALNPDVAKVCNRRKVAYAPGCATASEISQAEELGAEIVKIFPGEAAGGPAFVKDVRGPLPWAYLMPTGGVSPTEESLRGWFEAGVAAVGMGSALIKKDWVAAGDFTSITEKVKFSVETIRAIRAKHPLFY
jgi:2-dehydro-3-deoxyphosphogluconate aldolase / (4S)-4-hydroxy-2-oxoglutarate aldolase